MKTRHEVDHRIGLALQIGFLRMSGHVLNSISVVPVRALRLIADQLGTRAPRLASLRALYDRKLTLHEHQNVAKAVLGFGALGEHAKANARRAPSDTRGAAIDPAELATRARIWLYEHRYLIRGDRTGLDLARGVLHDSEAKLLREIDKRCPMRGANSGLRHWPSAVSRLRRSMACSGQKALCERGAAKDWWRPSTASSTCLRSKSIASPCRDSARTRESVCRPVARTKLIRFSRLRRTTRTISLVYFMKIAWWRAADDAIEAWLMRASELRGERRTVNRAKEKLKAG